MSIEKPAGYLPGDPRYGLQGEALKDYYRTKAAQWAIYCWDIGERSDAVLRTAMPGRRDPARAAAGAEELRQKFRRARDRLRPFRVRRRPRHAGHIVFHAARRPRGGGQIRRQRADEQGRRLPSASKSTAGRTASASARPTIAARECSSSCARDRRPARPSSSASTCTRTKSYFASYGDSFIFRGPIRSADGADNIGTALLLELPDRAAADKFWNEEPFAKNGGYQRDARITRWVFGD